jgi:hypothetical protein
MSKDKSLKRILSESRTRSTNIGLVAVVVVLVSLYVAAQEPAIPAPQDSKQQETRAQEAKPKDGKAAAKPAFTLKIKTKPILNLSLKAEKAKLADVTEQLSKGLKIPVFLGQGMEKQLISVEFSDLTLEPATQLMAPELYIDYEINMAAGNQPRPLGIFFYAANQSEPPANAVVRGNNQSLLVEGNTEDGVEPETEEEKKKQEEQPLRVVFENNSLTVKAKHQPLALVLLKIGEELGIPVDISSETSEIVDTVINKLPIEDAIRQLSPNVKLFMRADLQHAERRALRLVLGGPEKVTQQTP